MIIIVFSGWSSFAQNFRYFNPSFSPSGKQIAFETSSIGQCNIWICSLDGKDLKMVSDTLLDYGQPAWAPDERSLIYYGGNKPMQLYVYSFSEHKQSKINTPGDAYLPSWSKQNKIAFNSRTLTQNYNEISTMNLDGSDLKKLTDTLFESSGAKWSNNGKQILFVRSVTYKKPWRQLSEEEKKVMQKTRELMLKNESGKIERLTNDSIKQWAPIWSPDDKRIYFLCEEGSGNFIYEMNLKDKKIRALKKLDGNVQSISVSPDDEKFIYAAERDGVSGIYIWKRGEDKEICISEDW